MLPIKPLEKLVVLVQICDNESHYTTTLPIQYSNKDDLLKEFKRQIIQYRKDRKTFFADADKWREQEPFSTIPKPTTKDKEDHHKLYEAWFAKMPKPPHIITIAGQNFDPTDFITDDVYCPPTILTIDEWFRLTPITDRCVRPASSDPAT